MKCSNCGAELMDGDEVKFCPYCGHKVEIVEQVPDTIPGAIYGIAKSAIKVKADREKYNREHADEIEERERKKRQENNRMVLLYLLLMILAPIIIILFGNAIGLK